MDRSFFANARRLALLALIAVAPHAHAGFTTLTLPALNLDLETLSDGAAYSAIFPGLQTFNGVPFNLVEDATTGNEAFLIGDPDPLIAFEIPVNVFGVTTVYTLVNSLFGAFGATNATVTFVGSTDTHTANLVQGTNIRDHFQGIYNNVIDNVNAISAFDPGAGARLDEQIFALPAAFSAQTLVSISFTLDNSSVVDFINGLPFVAAATVSTPTLNGVPEPGTLALIGIAAAALALRRRKH